MANYMIWRIMMNRVTNLPQKYRSVRTEYYKVECICDLISKQIPININVQET